MKGENMENECRYPPDEVQKSKFKASAGFARVLMLALVLTGILAGGVFGFSYVKDNVLGSRIAALGPNPQCDSIPSSQINFAPFPPGKYSCNGTESKRETCYEENVEYSYCKKMPNKCELLYNVSNRTCACNGRMLDCPNGSTAVQSSACSFTAYDGGLVTGFRCENVSCTNNPIVCDPWSQLNTTCVMQPSGGNGRRCLNSPVKTLPIGCFKTQAEAGCTSTQTAQQPNECNVTLYDKSVFKGWKCIQKAPVCGNGVPESGERCDNPNGNGACPNPCSTSCQLNNCTTPPPPQCGNGVPEAGEQCDRGAENGNSCPATCSTTCTTRTCEQGGSGQGGSGQVSTTLRIQGKVTDNNNQPVVEVPIYIALGNGTTPLGDATTTRIKTVGNGAPLPRGHYEAMFERNNQAFAVRVVGNYRPSNYTGEIASICKNISANGYENCNISVNTPLLTQFDFVANAPTPAPAKPTAEITSISKSNNTATEGEKVNFTINAKSATGLGVKKVSLYYNPGIVSMDTLRCEDGASGPMGLPGLNNKFFLIGEKTFDGTSNNVTTTIEWNTQGLRTLEDLGYGGQTLDLVANKNLIVVNVEDTGTTGWRWCTGNPTYKTCSPNIDWGDCGAASRTVFTVTPNRSKLEIRARGTIGSTSETLPQMQVLYQDRVIDTVTLISHSQPNSYIYGLPKGAQAKDITLKYLNQGTGRSLFVDWIKIDGVIYQTEAPDTYSEGTWSNAEGRCVKGFTGGQYLNCNGFFKYKQTAPTTPPTTPPGDPTQTIRLEVRAKGYTNADGVLPRMRVLRRVNDNPVNIAVRNVSRTYQTYRFNVPGDTKPEDIIVRFINDSGNRNLQVDWIKLNGVTYQTEDAKTYSTGTYSGSTQSCTARFAQSEMLHCNGEFRFNQNQ